MTYLPCSCRTCCFFLFISFHLSCRPFVTFLLRIKEKHCASVSQKPKYTSPVLHPTLGKICCATAGFSCQQLHTHTHTQVCYLTSAPTYGYIYIKKKAKAINMKYPNWPTAIIYDGQRRLKRIKSKERN